jgi:proliferating cell nuclear antigen PCNA
MKVFTDDVVLRFNPEGLYMQGMDCSMCCCFEVCLSAGWFAEYEEVTEPFSIGVNSGILQKILAVHKDRQRIELTVTAESDILEVSFTSEETEKERPLDAFFEIPLMEIDQELMTFAPYESEADVIIGSEKLSDLVSKLKMFDERMSICFTDEAVVVTAKGVEGSMRTDITENDVIEYAIGEGVVLNQEYSLDFLALMGIFKKLNPEINLQFHSERPMEATYLISDTTYMKFFLAPKISTNIDY